MRQNAEPTAGRDASRSTGAGFGPSPSPPGRSRRSEVVLLGDREWNVEAARTADLYTDIVQLPADAGALLAHVAMRGWNLVAVELADGAVNLFDADYPERPCFVLGAELGGLPQEILDRARLVVQIPQWGLVPCLNLAVAGSIFVYDFLAKRHRAGGLRRADGGLVPDDGPSGGNSSG